MKVQGMTDRSSYYRYTYDPKEVKRLFALHLEKNKTKDVSRDHAIRSVHMLLAISYEEFTKRKSRKEQTNEMVNNLDFSVDNWVKRHYKRQVEAEEKMRIFFISPTGQYLPNVISGDDLADCMTFIDQIIEEGKNALLDEAKNPDLIDDPIWCLWSDIYPLLAH